MARVTVRPPLRPSSAPSAVHTKGTSVSAVLRFVTQNWGPEGLARLAEKVSPPEAAKLIRDSVLAGSWYPFSHFVALLDAAETVFGGGSGTFARREGMSCADFDLRGVYRVFVRLTSPAFLVERAGKVWRQYYDSGELVIVESSDHEVTFELKAFASPHRGHCETVLGWSERAAELSGATRVRASHPNCRARGDRRCIFRIDWE